MKDRHLLVLGGIAAAVGSYLLLTRNKTASVAELPSAPATKPTPSLPSGSALPPPRSIPSGTTAEIATQGGSLALRSESSSSSSVLAQMNMGETVFVVGSMALNGFLPVVYNGVSGFAYSGYLRELSFGPPTPGQPAAPAPAPAPGPTPAPAPVMAAPRLLTWPSMMKPGGRYKAAIHLGFARARLADTAAVVSELADAGFSNIQAHGSGADWTATGTWARGAEPFEKPDEITQAWEV